MDLNLLFQIISTTAVILGIVFGIVNLRNYQASRKRESALLMLNSFQTSEFVKGLKIVFELPDGAGKEQLDRLPPDEFLALYILIGTWERLGILVFRRELDIQLVDDAYSGPIIQSWQKLEKYVLEFRQWMKRDTAMEWFQWLAERMIDRETGAEPEPAYRAHRDWKA
ncbi:MAG: DUF4760 domain-containing protein [Anaerolineales bacterium]